MIEGEGLRLNDDLKRQRETVENLQAHISDIIQEAQQGQLHDKSCPIFSNTEDDSHECDCVVDEFIAKMDAAAGLLEYALDEREAGGPIEGEA